MDVGRSNSLFGFFGSSHYCGRSKSLFGFCAHLVQVVEPWAENTSETRLSSMSSSIEDNDDFQGSVFEFENKVASSKQMIDDKLSGADKIRLPSSDDDDNLI